MPRTHPKQPRTKFPQRKRSHDRARRSSARAASRLHITPTPTATPRSTNPTPYANDLNPVLKPRTQKPREREIKEKKTMDHPQTPRILAPHLSSFQHKLVRILGKVVQLRGEQAVIDAGGNVDVILNRVRRIIPLRKGLQLGLLEVRLRCSGRCADLWGNIGLPSRRRPRGRSHRQGGWELARQGAGCDGLWDQRRCVAPPYTFSSFD